MEKPKRKNRKVCSKSDIIRIMKKYSHFKKAVLDEKDDSFSYKNKKIIIDK